MQTSPWHRRIPGSAYHDTTDCPSGQRIRPQNRVTGTGGRPYCTIYRGMAKPLTGAGVGAGREDEEETRWRNRP